MNEEIDIDFKSNKVKNALILVAFMIILIVAMFITENVTKKKTTKELFEGMDIAYAQCRDRCGVQQPAFINLVDGTAECICLQVINDGSPINSSV